MDTPEVGLRSERVDRAEWKKGEDESERETAVVRDQSPPERRFTWNSSQSASTQHEEGQHTFRG